MNYSDFLSTYKFDPQKDLINEGGFGKIYRAWGEHDREVAIKACQVKNNKYTLKREYELASKLAKHDNIAFYESIFEFNIPGIGLMEYAVMQYYPDGDLRKVIETQRLSNEDKHEILTGILEGVSFLHKSGIIHRDLKPGNILMQKVLGKWRPKITDFGLGKAFSGNGEISNTSAGIVSLLYASPEQVLGKPTRPNTDLWPIGIITFLLFTGKYPFESNFPKETESYRSDISKKIISGQIPDSVSLVPEPFQRVIRRCLVIENSARTQDANELLDIIHSDSLLVETNSILLSTQQNKTINGGISNETTSVASKSDVIPDQSQSAKDPLPTQPKYHWASIVSFICGILGFYLGLFAIIFGIIALNKITSAKVPIKGKDMAIAGLTMAVVWFILAIIILIAAST